MMERAEETPVAAATVRRARESIILLEGYVASAVRADPWPYLEDYCRVCVLRLAWAGPGWDGRRLAVGDPEYEHHLREVVKIEWMRRGWPDVG